MLAPSRYQGRIPYQPGMSVGRYPAALAALDPAAASPWVPQTPQVQQAAPPMPAEAPMIGPMVGAMDNYADANSAGYAGAMPGPSPNQSFGGMLDAGLTAASLLSGPIGAAGLLGGMAVAADRGLTNPALGPMSVMAQLAGLGTTGTALNGLFGGGGGIVGTDPASMAADFYGIMDGTGVGGDVMGTDQASMSAQFGNMMDATPSGFFGGGFGGGGFGGGMGSQADGSVF